MSEENLSSVGEQAESTHTASQDNTEGCDTEHSVMQQGTEEGSETQPSADMSYKYEELHSRPFITPDSEIPENLLHLSHSFGYDSGRRGNLQLLDDRTLVFIAGNLLVLLDVSTKEQRYLRSCSGGGIGSITAHPSKEYFAVAEKGNQPNIIVYEYPSLQPVSVLRGGTEQAYSFVDYNRDGSLLASVGSAPDYMLTLWNWRQEEVMLSCKAISQEVYRVTFSPYNPALLTSSGSGHIKFWKMASTFTGLKLQGLMGHFGKTEATDIEGYVELPDGKVVSGSDWGNLLLWDGNSIKVEICRKGGRNCHTGVVKPFTLEDGQLMTIGSDGAVRGWDFESIDTADSNSQGSRLELEPMNELVVGHNVCLSSVVRSSLPDSFIWFAQDSSGAIWKLDLSFTYTAPDPECLFSFHAGPIQGLDVSRISHLMATTALDRSVKVFDFLDKTELTTSRFNQGGTALRWAPPVLNQRGSLLATGFEDGVVRLLELYNPQRLHLDAKLRLKQAFKPHNAPVTAVAYDRNAKILATGSSDSTVFFFTVGEKYNPVGFVHVPGPVQALEWSPYSHRENRLLILCQSGQVVEVHSPDPESERQPETFHLPELPRRFFRFRSIKSRIKREEEIARRQVVKEKRKKEREEKLKESKQKDPEPEEELPPIYIPERPSPLYCGFYSQPGQFWLSMGGFDSGYLYHCKFSEQQEQDPDQRQDEPFDFLPVHHTDDDPIRSVTFSSDRQLLLCGMHSGSIRVYPLQPRDHSLTSMQAYWALNVHDNQYGHLRHICCSFDDLFVLTAGDDGNVFSFSLLPPEELQKSLQRRRAKLPSPRVGLEEEALAQDIVDPAAYSIETAKQKLEKDRLRREAELKIAAKRKKLAELRKKYKELLDINQSLPEHVRLTPAEMQLDQRFTEEAERMKAQRVREVRQQMAWEEERCSIALSKLQDWFKDSLEANVVTVVAIRTDHRVSTYPLPALTEPSSQLIHQRRPSWPEGDEAAATGPRQSRAEPVKDSSKIEEEEVLHHPAARPPRIKLADQQEEEEVLHHPAAHPPRVKLADRQVRRLQKEEEKAEQARARIEKRKQKWAQLYAEKPSENYEDPQDVEAIRQAKENMGDLKLKSAEDYTVPKHLRMNTESKRAELIALEENSREKQMEMNRQIVALRNSKVHLVSQLRAQAQQIQKIQQHLAPHLHRPPPALPTILSEETPEKRLQYSRATLERYRLLREQRFQSMEQEEQEGVISILDQLEKEEGKEDRAEEERGEEGTSSLSASSVTTEEEETPVEEGAELSELEEELQREKEIRLLYEQNCLLEQMESSVLQFDAELRLLLHQKLRLDWQLKMADIHQLTLYQELLLLKVFERQEDSLQEKLNGCIKEENSITSKLEEYTQQLELKQGDIAKLQEREKALTATFQASLGEANKFEEFLTKVFKKKIKRVKKEQTKNEENEEDSDDDSDEDDDSVCPPGCEPELFENTLQLRERRLDLEELLSEEKKSAEALKKECDTLVKKEKSVQSSRKAAEVDLELINREKQQKMNELDVVVPLRLHQIELVTNGSVPSDLSQALVIDKAELNRLQERIKQLQVEKKQQKDLCRQVRQQHVRLLHDRKDLKANIQVLEEQCNQLMMTKFGRLVDMDALQTLSGDRKLEELKREKRRREAAYAKELKQWDAKVEEAREDLMEKTRRHTELLRRLQSLYDEKRELDQTLNARQKKVSRQFQDHRRRANQEEIRRLQELVKTQSQQVKALKREIAALSRKGVHVPPPCQAPLPPLAPLPSPTDYAHTSKQGPGYPSKQRKAQKSPGKTGR